MEDETGDGNGCGGLWEMNVKKKDNSVKEKAVT